MSGWWAQWAAAQWAAAQYRAALRAELEEAFRAGKMEDEKEWRR